MASPTSPPSPWPIAWDRCSCGPVLAPASDPGAPDTLTTTFSEPIKYASAETHPWQGKQAGVLHPASDLSVAGAVDVQPARLILLLDPGSKSLLDPGDSLRIAAGIVDLIGNRPAANNRLVVVEGNKRVPPPPPAVLNVQWDARVYDSRWSGPEGKPFVLSSRDGAGNWVPVQGAEGSIARNCTGTDCGQPLVPALDGSVPFPSVLITSDRPFRYESIVFSNLGAFVAGMTGEVGATLLDGTGGPSAPVHADPKTGYYQMRLIWEWEGRQRHAGRNGRLRLEDRYPIHGREAADDSLFVEDHRAVTGDSIPSG